MVILRSSFYLSAGGDVLHRGRLVTARRGFIRIVLGCDPKKAARRFSAARLH
jgi:hypothetical protein